MAICAPEAAETLLAAMRAHPLGREAALIGHVVEDERNFVADDDALRRRAHRRLAVGRTTSSHMLKPRDLRTG